MEYDFLKSEPGPKIILEAVKLLGVKEIVGPKHNSEILKWGKALGLGKIYTNDEIPWCGLFVGYVCLQAGKEIVSRPLWARDWLNWGTIEKVAMLGDILIFSRGTGGHVGFYVGEDSENYFVLGGNQSNEVNISRLSKARCIGIRRTPWKIAQPSNVRRIFLKSNGKISTNEA